MRGSLRLDRGRKSVASPTAAVTAPNIARPLRGLPAAERAEDHQLVAVAKGGADVAGGVAADEEAHVRADAVLLVDDAELQARETPVEVVEDVCDRRA